MIDRKEPIASLCSLERVVRRRGSEGGPTSIEKSHNATEEAAYGKQTLVAEDADGSGKQGERSKRQHEIVGPVERLPAVGQGKLLDGHGYGQRQGDEVPETQRPLSAR